MVLLKSSPAHRELDFHPSLKRACPWRGSYAAERARSYTDTEDSPVAAAAEEEAAHTAGGVAAGAVSDQVDSPDLDKLVAMSTFRCCC
jgi:hypothetical protein